MPAAEPVLQAVDLEWRAGGAAVIERVTFAVAAGEFVALMGRNGAGKSTVMDLLAGLRTPHAGTVRLDGRPLRQWPAAERARRLGHLPQAVRAQSPLSAEQVVMMGRYPHTDRWHAAEHDHAAVEQAMRDCGCLPLRGRRLSTLSGGERQRVLLAACLAQAPTMLLLDEPSTFLDVDQQLQSFALLRERTVSGRACVAVTHDLNLALAFCSRIIVLADRTVARDLAVADARGGDDWLELFSPRLQRVRASGGGAWIGYR